MLHLFIVNPVAGRGRALKLVKTIKKACKEEQIEFKIIVTKYPHHATEIARDFSSKQNCIIYSVGGDGTLNEVINGMARTDSSVCVVPAGSGNDFIKSIYENHRVYKNFEEYIRKCIHGNNKSIDIIKLGDMYAINICSIGLDALIGNNVSKFKNIPLITGKFAYLLSIFYTILFYKNTPHFTVVIDEDKQFENPVLIAIGNGKCYGGGVLATPLAVLDDGLFDVCVANVDISKKIYILSKLLPKYKKGKHIKLPVISYQKTKRVEIFSDTDLCVNFDGEIIYRKQLQLELIPKGINYRFI